MVGLPREFITSCNAENSVATHVTYGTSITATDITNQDLANFLLAIPFAADSTDMEGPTRTGNDITSITNGIIQIQPFHAVTTSLNILAPKFIVFSSVCELNLIMTADSHPYNIQCNANPNAFYV
jgi:hypothetical protein